MAQHFWYQPETDDGCPGPRAAHSCDIIGDTKLFVFGGWNGKKALNDLHILDVDKKKWIEVKAANPPTERNNHTTAVVGTKLYAHGGHDGSKWLSDLHVLETRPALTEHYHDLTWDPVLTSGTAPSPRACHTLTKVGNKLYMFGGYDGSKCFNDIDILDLDTRFWICGVAIKGTPPQARNAHTMTPIETKLYLFGGHSGNKHLTDLHVFDTVSLEWTQPSITGNVPPGLRGHTANLIGHKIYLFGGYDGKGRSNDLYILDTVNKKWIHPPESDQAPAGRQRHSACLVKANKLFIFGGFDGNKWLSDVHVLDVSRLDRDALTDASVRGLIGDLKRIVNDPEFSDVTLVVDGKEIYAHKAILATRCEHFRAMFSSKMREFHEGRVNIDLWSYQSVLATLEFLYTGSLGDRPSTVVAEVLGLADSFGLDGLKRLCESSMAHSIERENVCQLLRSADKYLAKDLKEKCMQYIKKNKKEVLRTDGFRSLKEAPDLLVEIMQTCETDEPEGGSAGSAGGSGQPL
uniref:BTB domain-containing protein n=1 Tax=Chromera velia CCMP2878 TaxID=1169474 RepID=A0A0G4GSZ3_9ALVE|mmetsp:Transcript_32032/g.63500  ORF Transcript_32032/g.63500 Transcript_32032/m.63500 type:complete len:518 (+) Transcript_32032:418-1971(+)|eukprot:Cvel_23236.t1-p1 / transcript=Cvel_23236.t1 / gene=Cvel_23236 / organism=Chromera_velia_CCMP2878 / gene_product=Rab9 effector protein with kelch motifs, putative / transcript_product=Rab9 effector protein with kelch motifs, putative / location=Cvel_scaffold2372:18327-25328(-) / protein_length=517 / sequence_SO=supercontig / SO=protein_coding / is_pseudo=false